MLRKLTRRGFLTGGAACVAARAAAGRAPELDQAAISFIQVTDTHVSRRRLYSKRRGYDVPSEESIRRCRAAVKDINECSLPYELVVHTGDLAETRDTTEARTAPSSRRRASGSRCLTVSRLIRGPLTRIASRPSHSLTGF